MYQLNNRLLTALALIASLTLTACASGTRPTAALTLRPSLPPNAALACPDLPPVVEPATWQDLMVNHIEVAGAYFDCKARHQALLDAILTTGKP